MEGEKSKMLKPNKETQKGNIKIIKNEFNKNYSLIHNNLLKDNRLSLAEKGALIILLNLPNNFKITTKATSNYLNITEPTFLKFLENYKKYGYLQITRHKNNYNYEFTDVSEQKVEFNYLYIKSYTLGQLNYFLNSKEIEPKYKELIKKAFENSLKGNQETKKLIDEVETKKESIIK